MKKKMVWLGATVLAVALVPLSAYAATNSLGSATKTEASAKLTPGTVVDNSKGVVESSASAIAAEQKQEKSNSAGKSEGSASAKLEPGVAAENSIGFAGSLPPSEVLTQIIDQLKDNAAKTGNQTAVVIYASESGQEKLTISLKDSTEKIVAQIQEKFKDAKALSASAVLAEQK